MAVLTGRTALATGASRGIGRGIAERPGRDGARVTAHYGRNEAAAKEAVAAIEAAGGEAFAIGVELGRPGDTDALWQEFDRHADGVDILVNNAGISTSRPIGEIDEDLGVRQGLRGEREGTALHRQARPGPAAGRRTGHQHLPPSSPGPR